MLPLNARFLRLAMGVIAILCAVMALFASTADATRIQQAPSSRIALELPESFEPAALFSGFTSEALGVSIVIVEMPAAAYTDLETGMTPEALAGRGITNARALKLTRPQPHIAMQAEQLGPSGNVAKLFVAFRESNLTALITANVEKASLDKGVVALPDIERILASARVADTPAPARELFRLTDLGPFKPAGQFMGTARMYTLDGRAAAPDHASPRPMVVVAPSLDRRPVPDLDGHARRLLTGLPGLATSRVLTESRVTIAGLPGIEIVAETQAQEARAATIAHQVVLVARVGGYFRILGQAPASERDTYLPAFQRIARSFEPLP